MNNLSIMEGNSTITNPIEILSFSWIEYTLFVSMLAISAFIGVYYGCFGSKQSTTKEYLLGNRSMGVFPVTMSLVASNLSGITLLAAPAEIYMHGTQYVVCVFGMLVLVIFSVYVYLPVFHELQLKSGYEYLELRFDKRIRTMATLVFAVKAFLYLPIVIYIPALAFSQVSGVSVDVMAPIICVVCIFYTTLGGLKGVVWSDTIQFSITTVAMFVILYMGITSAGGVGPIIQKAEENERLEFFNLDPDPTTRTTFWGVFIGFSAFAVNNYGIHQSSVQRYLSLPDLNSARKAAVYSSIGIALTKAISVVTGLIMFAKYHDCDPITSGKVKKMDQLVAYYVMDVARSIKGLSGIFVSGIFTTAMSAMSTILNTLAGTIYEDFVAPYTREKFSEQTSSNLIKMLVVLIGAISTGLVFLVEKLGGILQLQFSFVGVTGGPLLGLFTLGVFFPFVNAQGAFYGCIISFILMSWICVGQQFSNVKGPPIHKPLSTEGCPYPVNVTNATWDEIPEEPLFLYRISFYWYTFIGLVVCVIFGCLISYFTGKNKSVNRKTICPFVRRFIPKNRLEDYAEYTVIKGEVAVKN